MDIMPQVGNKTAESECPGYRLSMACLDCKVPTSLETRSFVREQKLGAAQWGL